MGRVWVAFAVWAHAVTLNLTNFRNVQYSLDVGLGTPPQPFSLMLESFSAWLWVPSVYCDVTYYPATFDPSASRTFHSSQVNLTLEYYGGHCSGAVSTDNLRINSSSAVIQLPGASFLLVSSEDAAMQYLQTDGFLGLGFTQGKKGIVQDLFESGAIPAPIFSLYLGDNKFGYEETNPRSALTLGTSLPQKFATAALTYFPLALPGVWSLAVDSVTVGSTPLPTSDTRVATLDVGMDVLVVFKSDYDWIFSQIAAAGSCRDLGDYVLARCDCLAEFDTSDYPSLHFRFSDMVATLTPERYFFLQSNFCLLLLTPSNSETWVLGAPFLRAYYTEFDFGLQRIGIAPAVPSETIVDSTTFFVWGVILLTLMSIGLAVVLFKVFQLRRRRLRLRQ